MPEVEPKEIVVGPYSKDLRERIAAAVDEHEGSQREIARRFRVNLSFVVRLLQRRRDADTLDPKSNGGGPPLCLGPDDRHRLAELIPRPPRRHLGATAAAGRILVPPDDPLAGVASHGADPQEEDLARRPIEELFSKFKEFLRPVAARVQGDLYDAIGEALRAVTIQDIIGWFQDSGLYAANG